MNTPTNSEALPLTTCSRSSEYPEGIEETWRADAGWKRADEAEAKLEELREAVRNFRDVSGRYHTEIACKRLFALLPENSVLSAPKVPITTTPFPPVE